MEKTRHQMQHELAEKLTNYWGVRAVCQLRYLEELVAHGAYPDAALPEAATGWLHARWRAAGGVNKADVAHFEALLEPARQAAKSFSVACTGHAHLDMNWMWGFDETVLFTVETFRTVLRLMEEYPGFTYLQSQGAVYKIVEEHAPELLDPIRERIRTGQWEVTASTWVEPDKNMPSGESLTRHMLYTRRYLKALLGLRNEDFELDFEPDTFGHSVQVPEILASGGVKYYYHCRGYDELSLFRWRAPSGAQVTVFREPNWYNTPIAYDTFLYVPGYCTAHGLDRTCHIFGVGDHGGGATRRDLERILDMAAWPCMPALAFGRLKDFFKYVEGKDLPVLEGELNFIFDGCYTTQTRIKKANRMAEAALGTAETLNVFSQLNGAYPYSAGAFEQAWENVLFNHFHDILPGSCTAESREYAMGMYQRTMACAGVRTNSAAQALAGQVNTAAVLPSVPLDAESVAEGAGVGFWAAAGRFTGSAGVQGGDSRLFVLFNPTQAHWNGPVEVAVWDWPFAPGRARVRDENGQALPLEVLDKVQQSYWAHSFFRLLVHCEIPAFGYRTVALLEDDEPLPVRAYDDPRVGRVPELALENEWVKARFDPETLRLVSFVEKTGGRELLDGSGCGGGFDFIEEDDRLGMTSWRMGRHMGRSPVVRHARVKSIENGPLRSRFTFEVEAASSKIEATVSLDVGARILRYSVHCHWREIGAPGQTVPQLAFGLPLAEPVEKCRYDIPFGTIDRAPLPHDVPAQSYAFAGGDAGGLMLVTDSKYGFRYDGQHLAVTLVRSAYDPDNLPEVADQVFSLGIGVAETNAAGVLMAASLQFCHAPLAVTASSHEGPLAPAGQFLSVRGAAVSALKMAEDGSGDLVVRLVGQTGSTGAATLEWPTAIKEAFYVDAHEEALPGPALPANTSTLAVDIRPCGVAAVRLRF